MLIVTWNVVGKGKGTAIVFDSEMVHLDIVECTGIVKMDLL